MNLLNDITEQHRQHALQQVSEISEEDLKHLAPLVILERNLHLGVDSKGNRLSTNDRATLRKTVDSLRAELANRYSAGSLVLLQTRLNSFHLSDPYVQEEIIKRKT